MSRANGNGSGAASGALIEALLEDGYTLREAEAEIAAATAEERAELGAEALARKLAAGPAPGEAEAALRELSGQVYREGRLPPKLRDAPAPPLRHEFPGGEVQRRLARLLARLRGSDLEDLPPAGRESVERLAALAVLALNEVAWELHEAERGSRVEERLSRGLTERR